MKIVKEQTTRLVVETDGWSLDLDWKRNVVRVTLKADTAPPKFLSARQEYDRPGNPVECMARRIVRRNSKGDVIGLDVAYLDRVARRIWFEHRACSDQNPPPTPLPKNPPRARPQAKKRKKKAEDGDGDSGI